MESPNTSPAGGLSLTQAARGKPIPTGLTLVPGHKSTEPGSTFTVLRVPFVICPFRGADAKSGKIVQEIPRSWHKTGVWILVSLGQYLRTHLTDHAKYDRGPEIHGEPRRVSLPSRRSSAGWMPESTGRWSVGVGRRHPGNYAQGVIQDTVDEASVSTATPDWRTVLSC